MVSLVVIFVIGYLVVLEVSVDECDICGLILMVMIFLFLFGEMVNCMLYLLVKFLMECIILMVILCMCWKVVLESVMVGVIVIELLV